MTAADVRGNGTLSGYLGKSFYADAYFDGAIDDFAVYGAALTPLALTGYAPTLAQSVTVTGTAGLRVGTTTTLTADVAPATTTVTDVRWTSSAPAVAAVDPSGKVTALAVGTTTITATAVDGSGRSGTLVVTVTPVPPTPALARPVLSGTVQPQGALPAKRPVVPSAVTGVTSGSVTFTAKLAGRTVVLGQVSVKAGVARLVLPASPQRGTYAKVVAALTVDGTAYSSSASTGSFAVVKAKPTSVVVTGKPFVRGSRPSVTVTVGTLTSGQVPVGQVRVYVSGRLVTTVKLPASAAGKVKVTLPQTYSRAITVKATFVPTSANVASRTSAPLTLAMR